MRFLGGVAARARDRRLATASLLFLCASLDSGICQAETQQGAVLLGLGLQSRSATKLSVGDSRPEGRMEPGLRFGADAFLSSDWLAGVSGHWAGSWFNFEGSGISGNLEEESWSVQGGVARKFTLGEKAHAYLGPGLEYGQENSQIENLVNTLAGPKTRFWALSLRGGIYQQVGKRLWLQAQVLQGFGISDARDDATNTDYEWSSPSTTLAIGMAWAIRER